MDETAKTLVTVISSLGGGGFVALIVQGLFKQLSGAAHREQVRNTSLAKQRDDAVRGRMAAEKEREEKVDKAESERDNADRLRRKAEEYVSVLKRQIRDLGGTPLKWDDLEEE